MAKGDATGGIGIGYNPGGPNIGGSATFGSRPMPPMMNGPSQTGIGPSQGMAQQFGSQTMQPMPDVPVGNTNLSNNYRPMPMPNRAQGPMIPPNTVGDPGMRINPEAQARMENGRPPMNTGYRDRLMNSQGVGPGFNPMESIMRMINMRSQGTATAPPMNPNNYAINPSANLFNKNQ